MASINQRNGKLFFDFRFRGLRCREHTNLDDNPENRKRAKKIIDRIEAEITLGTFDYSAYFPTSKKAHQFKLIEQRVQQTMSGVPLFGDFAEVWFAENEVGWKRSHATTVRGTLDKHLIPEFGEQPVNQLEKSEILSFRAALGKVNRRNGKVGLSAERINHVMTPLRMILNEAADRFAFVSPFRGIKSLKVPRTDVEPFSLKDVQKIITAVRPDFRNYYIVRFFTGMRSAEIDGLQWQYVDFEKRQILIRQTYVMGEITTAKTDGSQREICISQVVFDALKAQQKVTGKKQFVFCARNGNPLDGNNVCKRVWYPILRYLNLKERRPYQTRHTAATLWLAAGENPEWIARQMGHTTTEMLFRVYSRFVPNLTRQDGSAFEQLLLTNGLKGENHDE